MTRGNTYFSLWALRSSTAEFLCTNTETCNLRGLDSRTAEGDWTRGDSRVPPLCALQAEFFAQALGRQMAHALAAASAWGQMEQMKDPAACKPAIQMILYRPVWGRFLTCRPVFNRHCPEPLHRQASVSA